MNARAFNVTELAGGGTMPPDVLAALTGDEGAVLYGLPAEEYHAAERMSASGARKIRRSALHYKLMRDKPATPTPQQQFGTCVHTGILEPSTFDARVCGAPKVDKRTNAGKAEWAEFEAANVGKIVLSLDDFARAKRCIDAVHSHPAARRLLEGALTEVSLFWKDAKYAVPCKARLDIQSHGGITDVKTCTDASPEAFARSVATYEYHAQQAHYASGCEHVLDASPEFCAFIAVESDEPHAVAVYELPGNAMLAGGHLMNIALSRYAEALKTGAFVGYPDTIQTLQLPRWATSFAV